MTHADLEEMLARGAGPEPERGTACPDEYLVAGYVDGGLDMTQLQQLEAHLADCSHCLALVALLSRERDPYPGAQDSGQGSQRAQHAGRERNHWRAAPLWAVAASLVLAVPLLLQVGRAPSQGVEGQDRSALSGTRNSGSAALELRLIPAGAGTASGPLRPSLAWTEVAGSPYYDVRVVTDEGDVVVQYRVNGTNWQLPEGLDLQPGAEYYAIVEAYPEGGKAVSSQHVPFRIPE